MTVDDVFTQIIKVGRNARLPKLDLSDAFHHIRVRQQDWELLGSSFINDDGVKEYLTRLA